MRSPCVCGGPTLSAPNRSSSPTVLGGRHMRRQRPLSYTLAFLTAAISVVASPAALAAADDGADKQPTLPIDTAAPPAPAAPADEPRHDSEPAPDSTPAPEPSSTAPPTTT